ncbi:MAG: DMT family transporter, partial [Prevotellaceae bacterium]|nr:DMT family transporter [Prevotellaceae bacterium]
FGDFYPLVLLALLPSVMSFLFYVNAIQRIGMARANMFITLMPVFTLLFSAALGREGLHCRNLIGVAVVIAGLMLSQVQKK